MSARTGIFLLCTALLTACAQPRPISRPTTGPREAPPSAAAPRPAPVYQAPDLTTSGQPGLSFEATAPDPTAVTLAVLLPMSGALASSSEAIRDGILAAHYASGTATVLRFYDTRGDIAGMRIAYAEALREGTQAIIGPLRKEDVQALADGGAPVVPVLALNYLDPQRLAPSRLFQFGLSAEDEARAAARAAAAGGLRHALMLTPEGDWGERTREAFEQVFVANGGVIAAHQRYDARGTDFSAPIRTLLAIDASRERHRALTSLLGEKPEFEPRRRADVDLVFFAARGEAARQMAPQLRFHRASGLPLYATAQVYAGSDAMADLSGVRFCDGPWLTDESGVWADARNANEALFGGRAPELSRLSALGHDAYTLALLLAQGGLGAEPVAGASGRLRLDDSGAVQRELSCVEVAGGALKTAR